MPRPSSGAHRDLPSFPTRRSSELYGLPWFPPIRFDPLNGFALPAAIVLVFLLAFGRSGERVSRDAATELGRPPRSTLFPYAALFRALRPPVVPAHPLRPAERVRPARGHRAGVPAGVRQIGRAGQPGCRDRARAPTEIYPLSLRGALPSSTASRGSRPSASTR